MDDDKATETTPTRIVIDLADQPVIVLKDADRKEHEFPADTFMMAVHEAAIGAPETTATWFADLNTVIEKVTGFTVGPMKAGQIYATVLRLVNQYQKKASENLGLDTTSDSPPKTSAE